MLILIFALNAAISWANAWGCGKTWNETRAAGGLPHFLNWCGAVMSASGFTWCYLLIAAFFGGSIPFEHTVDGKEVVAPLLTAAQLTAFCNLGYLVILLPILGSGIAITVHSWGVMWRSRSFGDTAVSAWNTFAMGHNIYSAATTVPDVWSSLSGFFSSKDGKANGGVLVVLLVLACALGGVLTTSAIIRSTMRATAFSRRIQYERG